MSGRVKLTYAAQGSKPSIPPYLAQAETAKWQFFGAGDSANEALLNLAAQCLDAVEKMEQFTHPSDPIE